MIISVSRRTDIPAFYSDWFMKRIEERYLYVSNPMNRRQVSKVILTPDTVDCIVFWTKDVRPMLDKLELLDNKGFPYYFQYTITSYQSDIEPGLHNKSGIIPSFQELSRRIGADRVIWRYDPILINDKYTVDYHIHWYEAMCKRLKGYTNKCVISFLDFYTKMKRTMEQLNVREYTKEEIEKLVTSMVQIAYDNHMVVETCAEKIDLEQYGVQHGKCIDDKLISRLIQSPVNVSKDRNQREECGCVQSIDVGQYSTCIHYCKYCYANDSTLKVTERCKLYDVSSPILNYVLKGDENITLRDMKSIRSQDCGVQLELDLEQESSE